MPFGQDGSIDGIFAQPYAAQYFGNAEDEEIIGSAVDNWIYGRDGSDSLNGKKGAARSHIFEIGSAKNDVAGLEYEGTTIKIYRLDLDDICGVDIII